jgi:isopenicillin-N epimerase
MLVDHITSTPAVLVPVERVAALCRPRGVRLVVDGAHAVGQIALDVPATGADWYVSNLHKWCCTPKGCAFLWARRSVQGDMHPTAISHGYGRGFVPEFLWQATYDYSAYLAAPAALDWISTYGPAKMRASNHALVSWAATMLSESWGTTILCGAERHKQLALAVVEVPQHAVAAAPPVTSAQDGGHPALRLMRWLRSEGIEVPTFPFRGSTYCRVSAQLYNTRGDYEHLARVVLTQLVGLSEKDASAAVARAAAAADAAIESWRHQE